MFMSNLRYLNKIVVAPLQGIYVGVVPVTLQLIRQTRFPLATIYGMLDRMRKKS